MTIMEPKKIGDSVIPVENHRFAWGQGKYADNYNAPNQCYAHFVRSPHPHANIISIDKKHAESMPGVCAVFTGKDVMADIPETNPAFGNVPCGWLVTGSSGEPMKEMPHLMLAADKVRYEGDAVAVVLADTKEQAMAAAKKLDVTYQPLQAVMFTDDIDEVSTWVHEPAETNLCYDWALGDMEATQKAFDNAHHVVELPLVNNRLAANPIEPRCVLASYDPSIDEYDLMVTTQNPHVHRLLMAAFVFGMPEHKLRVRSYDVGGAFGSKIFVYPEECVCTWATKKVGRPVKWTASRREHLMVDAHGRDHRSVAKMAFDKKGKILGVWEDTRANLGAYLSTFAPSVPTWLHGTLMSGPYDIPAIFVRVRAYYTNTTPVDAYRGAGRPEAAYLLERLIEVGAREMGLTSEAIRRKNFVTQYPYQTQVAVVYDSGCYPELMDRALELSDYANFSERKKASEAEGKLRGIGMSSYIEACGIAPSKLVGQLGARAGLWEYASIHVDASGSVEVKVGIHPHGQDSETAIAQILSEKLGVAFGQVSVTHGDTQRVAYGMGTYGSRGAAVGFNAVMMAADKIIEKAKKIASHLLEVPEKDIEFEEGNFVVKGTDKLLPLGQIAMAASVPHQYPDDMEPLLAADAAYDPENFVYPGGIHICEVEIDPSTGVTEVVKYTAVDDFGTIINPVIVEGQVHGGVVQGIGQALMEEVAYDKDGRLMTDSLESYKLPRAVDVVDFKTDNIEIAPTKTNLLGVKGCGESGAIGAPPAVMNAVTHALGSEKIQMPATPQKVWQVLNQSN